MKLAITELPGDLRHGRATWLRIVDRSGCGAAEPEIGDQRIGDRQVELVEPELRRQARSVHRRDPGRTIVEIDPRRLESVGRTVDIDPRRIGGTEADAIGLSLQRRKPLLGAQARIGGKTERHAVRSGRQQLCRARATDVVELGARRRDDRRAVAQIGDLRVRNHLRSRRQDRPRIDQRAPDREVDQPRNLRVAGACGDVDTLELALRAEQCRTADARSDEGDAPTERTRRELLHSTLEIDPRKPRIANVDSQRGTRHDVEVGGERPVIGAALGCHEIRCPRPAHGSLEIDQPDPDTRARCPKYHDRLGRRARDAREQRTVLRRISVRIDQQRPLWIVPSLPARDAELRRVQPEIAERDDPVRIVPDVGGDRRIATEEVARALVEGSATCGQRRAR